MIGAVSLLTVLLMVVVMLWAAMAVLSRRGAEDVSQSSKGAGGRSRPLADSKAETEEDLDLDLPEPVIPGVAPISPLADGLGGGAFFSPEWEDDEAATEVAVRAPIAEAPPPPFSSLEVEDADMAATEVLDPATNPDLDAAIRAAVGSDDLGGPEGAYFDDDWDEEEAPTAIMTDDMASKFADMLFDDEEDD